LNSGQLSALHGLKRPKAALFIGPVFVESHLFGLGPTCASAQCEPLFDLPLFRRGELLFAGRHFVFADALMQQTVRGFAGNDRRAAFAAAEQRTHQSHV
jgi:hypothetical protein